jgi:hypothetical protein
MKWHTHMPGRPLEEELPNVPAPGDDEPEPEE